MKAKLTRTEITQRQRQRAKILKEEAKKAGFEPVIVWMRHDVKAALDTYAETHIDQQFQFDPNDFLDSVLTKALIDAGMDLAQVENEIAPTDGIFQLGAYVTVDKGEKTGWRKFHDIKLKATIRAAKEQGTTSHRAVEILEVIEQAKGKTL